MGEKPLDKIFIRDLLLRCLVGINPEEREKKQDVVLNIALAVDLTEAGSSDDIAATVDYKSLKNRVIELVEGSSFFLVERLATAIAEACLMEPRVCEATVTVDKPGALRFARSVAVEVTRGRE